MTVRRRAPLAVCLLAGFLLAPGGGFAPPGLPAQPLTERTANLEGAWVTSPQNLHFQFSHRFRVLGQDADVTDIFRDGKVTNYPTFDVGYGLPGGVMLGVDYSTRSRLARGLNEWQPYLKVRPLSDAGPAHVSVAIKPAYNGFSHSLDGEVAAEARPGPLVLSAAVRGFGAGFRPADEDGEAALAAGAGAALRLNRYVTLAADAADLVAGPDGDLAWSASLNVGIPYTPHTVALLATNVSSSTLEGLSVGDGDVVYWGFEFTVPFSGFARWGEVLDPGEARQRARERRGERGGRPRAVEAPGAAAGVEGRREGAPVVEVEVTEFAFEPGEVRIPAGTTVRWVNADPVAHTAVRREDGWESPLLGPSETYEFTFTRPGEYRYVCSLHPFMTGTVVVTEPGS